MRVYKRGNRWWVSERRDGKDVRRSLGPDVRTKAQALAVAKGKPVTPEPPKLTLRAFFKDFLTEAQIRLSPGSIIRYKRSFKALMYDLGDFLPVASLTNKALNQWAADLLRKGRAPEGINLDLRHIRAALRRGEDMGVILIAPNVDMVKVARRLPRHLTEDQVNSILQAEADDKFRRLWTFLVWTGVRRKEAYDLNWEDVTLGDRPSMRVIGKGDRERVVPILSPALEAMGPPQPFGPVFRLGGLDNMTAHFKMTAKKAGAPAARLHDLRHTCLTWLVGKGVPLKLVQDIAGHATITTTMNYAKIFTGNAHEVLEKALGF